MNNTANQTTPIQIKATGEVEPYSFGAFTNFFIYSATAAFLISFDGSTYFPANQNDSWGPFPNEHNQVYFKALNGVASNVVCNYGSIAYKTQNQNVTVTSSVTTSSLITNTLAGCTEAVPNQLAKVNPNNAATVSLTAAQTFFRHATIIAQKDLNGGANAGIVKVGVAAALGQQPYIMNPGDVITIDAPTGCKYDFAKWFLAVVTNGDGVAVIYS